MSTPSQTLNLPVNILPLTPLVSLDTVSCTLHNLADVKESFPPGSKSVANLDPLVKTKHSVTAPVDEESLVQLAEFAFNKTGTDDINDPHLNVLGGDAEGLGDVLVWEGAAWGAGGEGSEGEETDFAEENVVWETYSKNLVGRSVLNHYKMWDITIILDPAVVLIVKLLIILQITTGKDLEQVE